MKTEVQSIQLAFDSGQLQGEQGIPFLKAGGYSRFGIAHGQLQLVVQFSRKSVQLFVNFLCASWMLALGAGSPQPTQRAAVNKTAVLVASILLFRIINHFQF